MYRSSAFASLLVWALVCVQVLTLALPVSARAALDAPANWAPEGAHEMLAPALSASDPHPVNSPWNLWESHLAPDAIEALLFDRDSKIPSDFGIPKGMEAQVRFWLRIYTEFSSRQAVLFDEEHPEVIYEVVDFRNLARTARNRAAYEIVSRQVLKERLTAYRNAFSALRGQGSSARLAPEIRNISRARQNLRHAHRLDDLQKNLRVQWGQRDQVIEGLQASAPYRGRMDHVFEAMRLPRELTLLALVESSFNTRALSRTGAAGVWQFMPLSGAEFMVVRGDKGIDERISPIKSTVAAARLLQRNLKILGSWPSAISAYNNGHSKWLRVSKRDREAPGRLLTQCARDKGLPAKLGFASRNYYAEFLALLRAERYQELAFGSSQELNAQPVKFVRLDAPKVLAELSEEYRLAPSLLLELNPDVLNSKLPLPRGFMLAVPALSDDFSLIIVRNWAASRGRKARKSALQARAEEPTLPRRSG